MYFINNFRETVLFVAIAYRKLRYVIHIVKHAISYYKNNHCVFTYCLTFFRCTDRWFRDKSTPSALTF